MDPAAAIAAASVTALLISAGALWFTAWTSASARRSAAASEASALAAGKSVEIARATLDRGDAPTFTLTPDEPQNSALPVTITVVTGPPRINVTAVFNSTSKPAPPSSDGAAVVLAAQATLTVGDDRHWGTAQSPQPLVNGGRFEVKPYCVQDPVRVDVEVWLLSADAADPARQWHRIMRVAWPEIP